MIDNQLVCYQNNWIMTEIRKEVDRVISKVTYTEKIEARVLQKVGKYLIADSSRVKNRNFIIRLIRREIYDSLNRYKRELAINFSDVGGNELEDSEDGITYDPADVLANVESGLEIKEAITLLAKGDRKREMILTEWVNGSTNDSELSDTLASVFGGQARSHRIFIQRFRIECQSNYYSLAG